MHLRRLETESKSLEALVGEAVFKQLEVADSEAKAELYLKLCEKYVREVEEFLAKKEYVQASEKAWGATSQEVKALAGYSQILFIPALSKSLSSLAIASSPYLLIVAACRASESLKPNSTT